MFNDSCIKLPYLINPKVDKEKLIPGSIAFFNINGEITTFEDKDDAISMNRLVGVITEPDESIELENPDNYCFIAVSGIAYANITFKPNIGELLSINALGQPVATLSENRYTLGKIILVTDNKCYIQIK